VIDLLANERRQIEEAVETALRALLDLRSDLKCIAVDLIVERVELELALFERAQVEHVNRSVLGSAAMDDPDRAMLYELGMRVLCLEKKAGMPMSIADEMIADHTLARRRAAVEKSRRRIEAYREAKAESERSGSPEAIDRFVRELRREQLRESG
jgi:hypothetical protein